MLIVAGGNDNGDDIGTVLDSTEKLVLADTGARPPLSMSGNYWTETTPLRRGLYLMPSVSMENRIYILGNFIIYFDIFLAL